MIDPVIGSLEEEKTNLNMSKEDDESDSLSEGNGGWNERVENPNVIHSPPPVSNQPVKEEVDQQPFCSVRALCLRIIQNSGFRKLTMLVILLNTVCLAIVDYGHVDNRNNLVEYDSLRNKITNRSDIFFTIYFLLEFILKVVALGFADNPWATNSKFPETYMGDPWNWLDFVVVVSGLISLDPSIPSIKILRTFRVLRPLKTIGRFQGLANTMSAMLNAIVALGDVIVVVIAFFFIFGALGLQIFSGPYIHARCRLTPYPVNTSWTIGENFEAYRCLNAPNFDVPGVGPQFSKASSPWHHAQTHCFWPLDEGEEQLCSMTSFGDNPCYHDVDSVSEEYWRWCGADFDALGNPRFEEDTNPALHDASTFTEALNFGYFNFDNIGKSLLVVFQSLTGNGWASIMYQIMDCFSAPFGALYFVALICIGFYVMLKILIALMEKSLEDGDQRERINTQKSWLDLVLIKFKEYNEPPPGSTRSILAQYIQSPMYGSTMTFLIIANTIVLATEHYPSTTRFDDVVAAINFLLTMCFVADCSLTIFATGFYNYFKRYSNCFDFLIILISTIYIAITPIPHLLRTATQITTKSLPDKSHDNSSIDAFRVFRLLRLFLIFKSKTIRKLTYQILRSILSLLNFVILLMLYIIVFALIGQEFYANRFRFNEEGMVITEINSEEWIRAPERPRPNFDDFPHAVAAVFQILTFDELITVMANCGRSLGPKGFIFPVICALVGGFIMTNLFLALLISNFFEGNVDVRAAREALKVANAVAKVFKKNRSKFNKNASEKLASVKKMIYVDRKLWLQLDRDDFSTSSPRNGSVVLPIEDQQHSRSKSKKSIETESSSKKDEVERKSEDKPVVVVAKHDRGDGTPVEVEITEEEEFDRELVDKEVFSLTEMQLLSAGEDEEAEEVNNDDLDGYYDDGGSCGEQGAGAESGIESGRDTSSVRRRGIERAFAADAEDFEAEESSCLLWVQRNCSCFSPVHQWVAYAVTHRYFERVILFFILLSCVCLPMDTPLLDPNALLARTLNVIDYVITAAFTTEMLLKMTGLGLYSFKDAYFRDSWNILDFIIVVAAILGSSPLNFNQARHIKTIRVLRAFRPLRLLGKLGGLKRITTALVSAMTEVAGVAFIVFIIYFVFSVFFTNVFKGQFRSCAGSVFDSTISVNKDYMSLLEYPKAWRLLHSDQRSFFGVNSSALNFSSPFTCISSSNDDAARIGSGAEAADGPCCANSAPSHTVYEILTNLEPTSRMYCECWGGEWKPTILRLFDNVPQTILNIYQICTLEGWAVQMYAAVDSRGQDMQPIQDHDVSWIFYFIFFIIVASFLGFGIFVAVISESFHKKRLGTSVLTPPEMEWMKTKTLIAREKPMKPPRIFEENSIRRAFADICKNKYVESFFTFFIFAQCIVLAAFVYGQSDEAAQFLLIVNGIISAVFVVEAVMKIIGFGFVEYLSDNWNKFDCLVAFGSFIGFVLLVVRGDSVSLVGNLLRLLRMARPLRKVSATLRDLFDALYVALPLLGNVILLIFVVFYVVSAIGVQSFALFAYNKSYNESANFRTFGKAMLTLFRFTTGTLWNDFMYDVAEKTLNCVDYPTYNDQMCGFHDFPGCIPLNGCGNISIFPFLVIYLMVMQFIFLNVFVAVIVSEFATIQDVILKPDTFVRYRDLWLHFDPQGGGFISVSRVEEFVRRLQQPLGFEGVKYSKNQLLRRVGKLKVNADGHVYFTDLLMCLSAAFYERKVQWAEGIKFSLKHPLEEKREMKLHSKRAKLMKSPTRRFAQSLYNSKKLTDGISNGSIKLRKNIFEDRLPLHVFASALKGTKGKSGKQNLMLINASYLRVAGDVHATVVHDKAARIIQEAWHHHRLKHIHRFHSAHSIHSSRSLSFSTKLQEQQQHYGDCDVDSDSDYTNFAWNFRVSSDSQARSRSSSGGGSLDSKPSILSDSLRIICGGAENWRSWIQSW